MLDPIEHSQWVPLSPGSLRPLTRVAVHGRRAGPLTHLRRLQYRYTLLKGPIRQKEDRKNRVKKLRTVGRIYGMKVEIERAIKTKVHPTTNNNNQKKKKKSEQVWLVYVRNINRNIPTTRR